MANGDDMTVGALIDYLLQMKDPDETEVVLYDDDFTGTGDYIALAHVLGGM